MEMAGHYRNWHGNFSVILAKEDTWYRVDTLFSIIMTIRKFDLSGVAGRKATWALFNNWNGGFPASETARFPENEFYIRESDWEWAAKFTQLWSGLAQLEKKYAEEADAVVKLVQNVLENILKNLRSKVQVIDRAEFEQKNKLTWEAPDDSN